MSEKENQFQSSSTPTGAKRRTQTMLSTQETGGPSTSPPGLNSPALGPQSLPPHLTSAVARLPHAEPPQHRVVTLKLRGGLRLELLGRDNLLPRPPPSVLPEEDPSTTAAYEAAFSPQLPDDEPSSFHPVHVAGAEALRREAEALAEMANVC